MAADHIIDMPVFKDKPDTPPNHQSDVELTWKNRERNFNL